MRYFFSHLSQQESRLIFHERPVFSIGPREQSDEQRSSPETLPDARLHCAPSTTMQQKMNETGECLVGSRAEYRKSLLQQYTYLTTRLEKLRFPFGYKAEARNKALYHSFTEKNSGKNYKNDPYQNELIAIRDKEIHELEIEQQKVTSEMARMKAEEAAGFPDTAPAIPAPTPTNAPPEQVIGRPTILTVGEGRRPAGSRLEDFRGKATPEEVDAVMGIEPALREIAATLWETLPEGEGRETMLSLCEKMRNADEETLDAFFDFYFKEGAILAHDTVEIDEKIAGASKAKEFSALLSLEERTMIGKFITTSLESMEKVATFEDMTPPTKERIKKYIERLNKPPVDPESANYLIAEGMLYLDGVDVDESRKQGGGKIDETKIVLLGSDQRFMGIISGWIKLIMGWKKLLGAMTKPKEKEVILKKPDEMSKEERESEIATNSAQITTLEKQEKALPAQIKELQEKNKPDLDTGEKETIEAKIASLKKELADVKKKREELEGRNEGLEEVKVTKKEEPVPKEEVSTVEDVELSLN